MAAFPLRMAHREPPPSERADSVKICFASGETLRYDVAYRIAGSSIPAGEVAFTTTLETLGERPVYHSLCSGNTLPFYDHFFKVRDVYETFMDTATLQPQKFVRKVMEGGYKKFEQVTFNHNSNVAVSNAGVFRVPAGVNDVVSAMYRLRGFDYSKVKEGEKIPFVLFLSDQLYGMYVRYVKKERLATKFGVINTIRLKPLLIKGEDFKGGEKMTIWVTDNENRVPVRIESEISVGSVSAELTSFQNLRYPTPGIAAN